MKSIIREYLKYGFVMPSIDHWYERKLYESEEIQHTLNDILSTVINELIPNPDDVTFQLSGGFDSTVIASYFKRPNTFCVSHEDSPDIEYAHQVSKKFETNLTSVTEEVLLEHIDIRHTLYELHSKINYYPRGHINDIYLFHTLQTLRDIGVNTIAGGEGTELLFVGYMDMYRRFLELAVSNGDYKNRVANLYYESGSKHSQPLDFKNIIGMNRKTLYLSTIDWWTSQFSDHEVYRLIGGDEIRYSDLSVHGVMNYIWGTLGKEYYYQRKHDFCKYFDMKWITPFTDERFVRYAMTLPIESKYCVRYPKHIFYEAFKYRVPNFVYDRPKVGLFLSDRFFLSKKEEIEKLIKEFLWDKDYRIYNHVDYKEVMKYVSDYDYSFHKVWSLLNLSMWMEINEQG